MLEIIRGDDVKLEFTFADSDGVAIDLTGAEIFFTVKEHSSDLDADAVLIKDFSFVGDGSSGILEVELEPTDTNLDAKAYSYDVQVKNGEGYIISSAVGKLYVKRDITIRTEMSA